MRHWALVAGLAALACGAGQAQSPGTVRDRYDFDRPGASYTLPGRLDEISGLALTPDGRLFAHDDERATIHEIDLSTGEVGKRFSLGEPPLEGDFEGLAVAGDRFFLVTSEGVLYEFAEGADREAVAYDTRDTGLAGCEVEGLDHDAASGELLLACKTLTPERDVLVVHRLRVDGAGGATPSPIKVPRSALAAVGPEEDFEPSAIAVSPTGSLVLVSAP
ncbi:MAG TPA: hypothetical protein VFQ22_06525, partial [Longimicrobiales bacterium]|nr:hypothetical protein [Longimicrobiales bacterium]